MLTEKDFTLKRYIQLCYAIKDNYNVLNLYEYFLDYYFDNEFDISFIEKSSKSQRRSYAIIRHDVDRNINNALLMAEAEERLGISASYYFRYPYTFNPEIIRKIKKMGHEIGYHYETLSKARGDYSLAIKLFEQELEAFREICDVKTICMHGKPTSSYDNRNLWNKYNFSDYGIIGEAYLSVSNVEYFSDTGRNWNGSNSLRDNLSDSIKRKDIFFPSKTDELIDYINIGNLNNLYFTVHPERWIDNKLGWSLSYIKDFLSGTRKKVLRSIIKY